MRSLRLFAITFALSALACEKQHASASTTTPDDAAATSEEGHGEPGHSEPGHEHEFEGSVKSLHDVLAPLWHAPHDESRPTNTCAAVAELAAKASAIEAEPVPAAASDKAEAWKAAAAELARLTNELQTVCAGDLENFEAAFTSMHSAFHVLIEIPGEQH